MNTQEQTAFLEQLFDADQSPRKAFAEAETEEEKEKFRNVMIEEDPKILDAFLDHIEKHEWPKASIHGKKACDAAWLIIQHSSIELVQKFLPVMKDLAEQGEASKKHIAMMEDRLLMWQEQPQIYGSQAMGSEKGKYIWPVQNPDIIDDLRKNMNFTNSIQEYAADMEAIYDPKLKVPDILRLL